METNELLERITALERKVKRLRKRGKGYHADIVSLDQRLTPLEEFLDGVPAFGAAFEGIKHVAGDTEDDVPLASQVAAMRKYMHAAIDQRDALQVETEGLRQIWSELCNTLTEISGKNDQGVPKWNECHGGTPSDYAIAYVKALATELAAIRERCEAAQWTLTPSSQISTCDSIADVPTLLAEVERLRGLLKNDYRDLYSHYNPGPIDEEQFNEAWNNSASRARLEESK
jgi:hypothetical protein